MNTTAMMEDVSELELLAATGGENAAMIWGAQAAADGLKHANSSNPIVMLGGTIFAAAGGWVWAFGSFYDGVKQLAGR